MNKIAGFRGKYFFLSNFFPIKVIVDGVIYKNTEAAFQSFKHEDDKQREFFSALNPYDAKRAGQNCRLRKDWERIKEDIMYKVVLAKFTQNRILKYNLLHTGDSILIGE